MGVVKWLKTPALVLLRRFLQVSQPTLAFNLIYHRTFKQGHDMTSIFFGWHLKVNCTRMTNWHFTSGSFFVCFVLNKKKKNQKLVWWQDAMSHVIFAERAAGSAGIALTSLREQRDNPYKSLEVLIMKLEARWGEREKDNADILTKVWVSRPSHVFPTSC